MNFLRRWLGKISPAGHWLLAGGLAVAVTACGSDDPAGSGEEGMPQSPGIYRRVLLPGSQRYTISIPAGYDTRQPTPLILSLHFGGAVTPFYGGQMLEILVLPALAELGAIFVAPDATSGGWDNVESEKNVLDLVRVIKANYAIDEARTLVTGFSMGGRGTWYMAARHPDLFRAAIPISARPEENAANVDWRIPLLVIHSVADEVIPFDPVETTVRALIDKGVRIEMIVVQGLTHFQTDLFVAPLKAALPWIREAWGE